MKKTDERRRYLRYNPQSVHALDLEQKSVEAICHLDINDDPTEFRPSLLGMVVEKSHAGCSLVMVRIDDSCDNLRAGTICTAKTGPLHPLKAVIVWRQDLSADLFKLGLQYSE